MTNEHTRGFEVVMHRWVCRIFQSLVLVRVMRWRFYKKHYRWWKTCQKVLKIWECVVLILLLDTAKHNSLTLHRLGDRLFESWLPRSRNSGNVIPNLECDFDHDTEFQSLTLSDIIFFILMSSSNAFLALFSEFFIFQELFPQNVLGRIRLWVVPCHANVRDPRLPSIYLLNFNSNC